MVLAGLFPAIAHAAPNNADAAGQLLQRRVDYDSRDSLRTASGLSAAVRRSAAADSSPVAVRQLREQLGLQGIVDIDNATGTPRRVARTDGFLTAASTRKPADIALDYLSAHTDVFGVDAKTLAVRQDYTDIEGTHHLSFVQSAGGVPVFGNGLKAHVARDGRLIQVDGAPVKHLPAAMSRAKLSATAARAAAVKDVEGTSATVTKNADGPQEITTFSDGGSARLVWFQTADGPRLAWQTLLLRDGFVHVVDAASGQVRYRHNTVDNDTAEVWTDYPGAPNGGKQQRTSLNKWLPDNSPRLAGYYAHVYSDVNDDNTANPAEEVRPAAKGGFEYPFTDFTKTVGGRCAATLPCSWDPKTPNSWQANRAQNAVQLFSYLGRYHDHLAAGPIGFTRTAGNFEAVDGDAVQAEADDGADTAGGLPDGNHVSNANMSTPPDGSPPRMQMYLFTPGTQFLAGNSGDEADVVYHEYTHGLSNRLVVDANGVSTLSGAQAGAMGEGWSDWYAEDFLAGQGLEKDTAANGEIRLGKYWTAGGTIRTQPLDCAVGAPATACPGTSLTHSGGYTYGDYGRLSGFAEAHDDGEIWGETLWDLRTAVGSAKAESLITRAMELTPANPSFLDERNSILQADLVVDGGKLQKTIWQVFAHRGMGYFAAASDGDDIQPVEDFSMPPAADTPRGTLTGTVTDQDSGAPIAGVTVAFGGHASGFAGGLVATTAADGTYTISGILPGTYPKVVARGPGFDPAEKTLSVPSHPMSQDWTVRRDWAAASGGGTLASFTGPDFSPMCGPGNMIDQSQSKGWVSFGQPGGLNVVVKLPSKVDIAEVVVNPTPVCISLESVQTAQYLVETSADGTTWTTAAQGTFPSATFTPTPVALTPGTGKGTGFVRYTMLSTRAQEDGLCGPGTSTLGCFFISSTELAVYGKPAA